MTKYVSCCEVVQAAVKPGMTLKALITFTCCKGNTSKVPSARVCAFDIFSRTVLHPWSAIPVFLRSKKIRLSFTVDDDLEVSGTKDSEITVRILACIGCVFNNIRLACTVRIAFKTEPPERYCNHGYPSHKTTTAIRVQPKLQLLPLLAPSLLCVAVFISPNIPSHSNVT